MGHYDRRSRGIGERNRATCYTYESRMMIECRNQQLPVEICIGKDCYEQDYTSLIMSCPRRLNSDLVNAEPLSPVRVLWWWKEGDVPVVLIENEVHVALLRYFLVNEYLSKPRRSNVVSVEGHIECSGSP